MLLMIDLVKQQIMDIKKVVHFILMYVMQLQVIQNIFAMQVRCQQLQIVKAIS